MSVCDEGWGDGWCPAINDYVYGYLLRFACNLRGELEEPPTTCPYAPILRVLVEAKEMDGLTMVPAENDWLEVKFYVRRGGE